MSEFLLGVLASLVAGVVVFILKIIWPNLTDKCLYKGVRVEGMWDVMEERSGRSLKVGRLELKQRGCRLTGISSRTKTRDGKNSDRKFNYHGLINGNQVTLVFEDALGVGFDTGTYVFTVYNDGTTMVGMATFHGKRENKIISEPRILRKTVA
ncbi:hypothetical protein P3S37_10565 [Enterobacter hormaechei]|uniref:hypothetical protein n=1 Tax=Enterobacter cloacae complex TaxID=354276 RepID=UPI00079AA171|nr:hypothetical protein [Enterobacter hormaechei]EKY4104500.1 hypothetical protein [Enterobacter hormaechei subsp. steigerwaltii]KZQ23149.1 hypothetical protein A3N39_05170 [Enterobacter hormaechei subsp. steigerwaltii]MCL8104389.1 hypothetical protein [Enterobacter hormaechei]MCM8294494.1 hypothetical protein [Enterobacter hormaechei]MCM8307086.1 hypothetical protein [Enterobacter hormaechei]